MLNRRLAESGHYPAIDIEQSISRAMPQVVPEEHMRSAQTLKQHWSRYHQNQDLIAIGAYNQGSDKDIDEAIRMVTPIRQFLQQGLNERVSFEESRAQLARLMPQQPAQNNRGLAKGRKLAKPGKGGSAKGAVNG